ncbi:unnamed protein product [Parnassius apollo]|uniref:(apollo) hypothetical protein n=1 Tax=Parnassius apollo TaxID=110799 RepID=A0A8S3WIG3_PARAO|nr:unnamed protein product [Parnassius apollo]
MFRTPEKCNSDSNLPRVPDDKETSPPSFVSSRIKRKRSEEILTDLADFKAEMKEMITSWMDQQNSERTEITSALRSIEESLSFLSTKYDDMCKKVDLMEQERHKQKEYITILENKVENLMKAQRKYSFELKNVPRSEKESKETLLNMFKPKSERSTQEVSPELATSNAHVDIFEVVKYHNCCKTLFALVSFARQY